MIKFRVTLFSENPTVIFRTYIGDWTWRPVFFLHFQIWWAGKNRRITSDCVERSGWSGWLWVHTYTPCWSHTHRPATHLTPFRFYAEQKWEPFVQWFIQFALENHDTNPQKRWTICANLPPIYNYSTKMLPILFWGLLKCLNCVNFT